MNTTTIDTIKTLRAQSESTWALCVETAGIADCGDRHDADRESDAQRAADTADSCWDDAEGALENGDTAGAIESLQQAARLGSEWGDDAPEREAIALLGG